MELSPPGNTVASLHITIGSYSNSIGGKSTPERFRVISGLDPDNAGLGPGPDTESEIYCSVTVTFGWALEVSNCPVRAARSDILLSSQKSSQLAYQLG